VAVVVDPAWVSINPATRQLRDQWRQAISGVRPVTVGSLQVYLLRSARA
jgi:hypothetical protein